MALLKIDPDLCIGCGLCVEICPKIFEMREEKAWLIPPKILEIREKHAVVAGPPEEGACDYRLASDSCPVAAIQIE